MKKILFLISVIAIVLISGCNQPKSNIDTIPQGEGGEKVSTTIIKIDIKSYSFMPNIITIKKGQTVIWTNSDNIPHTVTSLTGEFDSLRIEPGSEYKYEFNMSGPYEYSCTIHPSMPHGKITVSE